MKEDDRNIVTQARTHICSYATNEDIHYRWEPPQKIIYDAPYVKPEPRTGQPGQIIACDKNFNPIQSYQAPSQPKDRFGWIIKLLVRIKILEGVKDE